MGDAVTFRECNGLFTKAVVERFVVRRSRQAPRDVDIFSQYPGVESFIEHVKTIALTVHMGKLRHFLNHEAGRQLIQLSFVHPNIKTDYLSGYDDVRNVFIHLFVKYIRAHFLDIDFRNKSIFFSFFLSSEIEIENDSNTHNRNRYATPCEQSESFQKEHTVLYILICCCCVVLSFCIFCQVEFNVPY